MGWERRGRGAASGYFYRSVRIGGGVRKEYLGRHAEAHDAAEAVEQRRRLRLADRAAVAGEAAATDRAEELADELFSWAGVLSQAAMVAAGHHYHKGQWRRRRGEGPEGR